MNPNSSHNLEYHSRLFCFSGINGSGKTSLIEGVSQEMKDLGHDVATAKAYTEDARNVLDERLYDMDVVEIMFAFQALQRRQRNKVLEKLDSNPSAIVLADRWNEPYHMYHSENGPLASMPNLRRDLDHLATGGLMPGTTYYLRVSAETAIGRRRADDKDFFDSKPISVHEGEVKRYDALAESDASWVTVDATMPPGLLISNTVKDILWKLELPEEN